MKYQPNLTHKRVIRAITKAYGFTLACLRKHKPESWSQSALETNYGRQNDNLGQWIRKHILICTDDHYSMHHGKCKKYIYNINGMNYFRDIIKQETLLPFSEWLDIQDKKTSLPKIIKVEVEKKDIVIDYKSIYKWATKEHKDELETKQFIYKDISHRLYHGIQRIKREYKHVLLKEFDLVHHYDIECCAPTLLMQYALKLNNKKTYPTIKHYLDNKTQIRNDLASYLNITTKNVKKMITAIVNGAPIKYEIGAAITEYMMNDESRIELLQTNKFIIALKKDLSKMWSVISNEIKKTILVKKITCKVKSNQYFQLERQVLDSVITYLDNNSHKYLLEHDGWCTTSSVNVLSLVSHVRDVTGYNVCVSYDDMSNVSVSDITIDRASAAHSSECDIVDTM